MTKKRFTIDECGNITDTVTNRTLYVENRYTECNYYVNLLNTLADENEQLKEDNLLLIDDSEKYRKLSIQFDNRNKKLVMKNALLEKENEQLKSEIKDLNDILARYEEKELQE